MISPIRTVSQAVADPGVIGSNKLAFGQNGLDHESAKRREKHESPSPGPAATASDPTRIAEVGAPGRGPSGRGGPSGEVSLG